MLVRKKRGEVKRLPPIELDITNPQHERLYDYVQRLTETGEAAQWIRAALVAALPTEYKDKDEVQRTYTAPTPMKPIGNPRPLERSFTPVPKPGKGK